MKKQNKCCICHKIIDYKPIRLVKQLNDNKKIYNTYHNIKNYDFCKDCFKIFQKWILKHNRKEN